MNKLEKMIWAAVYAGEFRYQRQRCVNTDDEEIDIEDCVAAADSAVYALRGYQKDAQKNKLPFHVFGKKRARNGKKIMTKKKQIRFEEWEGECFYYDLVDERYVQEFWYDKETFKEAILAAHKRGYSILPTKVIPCKRVHFNFNSEARHIIEERGEALEFPEEFMEKVSEEAMVDLQVELDAWC